MRRLIKSDRTLARARKLRAEMGDEERILWMLLRDRRFTEFKFRRQVPLGDYVADFVCFGAKLVVELDGSQHAEPEQTSSTRCARNTSKPPASASRASGAAISSKTAKPR